MAKRKSNSEMRWEKVEKAEKATATGLTSPTGGHLPEKERDLYELFAKYVISNSSGDRNAENKAKRLLLMLDRKADPRDVRVAFVEMSMAFPGAGTPEPSLQRAFEHGKKSVRASLWAGIASDSTETLLGVIKKIAEKVADSLPNVIGAIRESREGRKERAIESLLNATKFETLKNMSEILPAGWEKLYANGLIDIDDKGHISITDERYVDEVIDLTMEELDGISGMNPYAIRHDAKQVEEGLNMIVRKKVDALQEKENEKHAIGRIARDRTHHKESVAVGMRKWKDEIASRQR